MSSGALFCFQYFQYFLESLKRAADDMELGVVIMLMTCKSVSLYHLQVMVCPTKYLPALDKLKMKPDKNELLIVMSYNSRKRVDLCIEPRCLRRSSYLIEGRCFWINFSLLSQLKTLKSPSVREMGGQKVWYINNKFCINRVPYWGKKWLIFWYMHWWPPLLITSVSRYLFSPNAAKFGS